MAKQTKKQEIKFELTKFNPSSIVDFSEWEKRQQQTLADNPFIEVVDNESWEIGKQRRTALRTARTTLQNERDDVKKELNNIKTFVANKYDEFIEITTPAENKQQENVKAFEAIKEAEKAKEAEIEQQRVDGIRGRMDDIEMMLDAVVQNLKFETRGDDTVIFDDIVEDGGKMDWMEMAFLFNEMVARQRDQLESQIEFVTDQENKRLEDLKIKQQSLIDGLYIKANQAIDAMVFETIKETKIEVENIFTTKFDFGEFGDKFESVAEQMFTKLDRSIKRIQSDQEQLAIQKRQDDIRNRQDELNRQRNRIVEIREGLLDLIFQMTVDNYTDQTGVIKTKTESIPEKLDAELKMDWDRMVGQVKTTFNQKMEMINGQLKQRDFEKSQIEIARTKQLNARMKQLVDLGMERDEKSDCFYLSGTDKMDLTMISESKMETLDDDQWNKIIEFNEMVKAQNKIDNERWDTRKPVLEKNGFIYDEIQEKFEFKSFPVITVALETVLTNGDESWRIVMNDLMDAISTANANDAKEQKRQKSLAGDKKKLTGFIKENSFTLKTTGIKNDEIAELAVAIRKEFDQWMETKIEQIKQF